MVYDEYDYYGSNDIHCYRFGFIGTDIEFVDHNTEMIESLSKEISDELDKEIISKMIEASKTWNLK